MKGEPELNCAPGLIHVKTHMAKRKEEVVLVVLVVVVTFSPAHSIES